MQVLTNYCTSRPIRHTFIPEKCYLNSTYVSIISKLINTRTSIIQHLYHDYDFCGSDNDFLGFYDE
jgi:hypothetical protein